jgi:hypothetical protein
MEETKTEINIRIEFEKSMGNIFMAFSSGLIIGLSGMKSSVIQRGDSKRKKNRKMQIRK